MEIEITPQKLANFKDAIINSCFLTNEERIQIEMIPESFFEKILRENFNGNFELAKAILFDEYESIYMDDLKSDFKKIYNYDKSVNAIKSAIEKGRKIVLVTDIDNDGSMSQAIAMEAKYLMPKELKNLSIIFAQEINGNAERGITVDLVDAWFEKNKISKNEEVLVITADNGINSLNEQEKINKEFPNVTLLITDHHTPDAELVVKENDKTLIFNPKYKPQGYFLTEGNISGAYTLGLLFERLYTDLYPENQNNLASMQKLERISNMLDYVKSDVRLKPYEFDIIDKFVNLGVLMNVNNSVSTIIRNEFDIDKFERIFMDEKDVNKDAIKDAILEIKEQNLMAQKLLYISKTFYDSYEELTKYYEADVYYTDITNILLSDLEKSVANLNTNYLEQLRPIIYHLNVKEYLTPYESEMLNTMTDTYEKVRGAERKIINEIRKSDIVKSIYKDHVTILYYKDNLVNEFFSRKLIMKAMNENNKGFYAVFNNIQKDTASGSFRGLYNSNVIIDSDYDEFKYKFIGHPKAAGLKLTSHNGKITEADIEAFANYLNDRLAVIKANDVINNKMVYIDFTNFSLIKKINTKVRAQMNNMAMIEPIVKLNRSIYFTNQKTLETESLQSKLSESKFGYIPITLNFHDDVMIFPKELVREIYENNFKDYIRCTYLADGTFMANSIVRAENIAPRNVLKLYSEKKEEQRKLIDYYEEHFLEKDTFTKELSRETLASTEIFNRNDFGRGEFNKVEEFILKMMDEMKINKYVIIDTEANGLGKAPKLFNFGALEIREKPNVAEIYDEDDFKEKINDPINRILFKKKIRNITHDKVNKKVIINREIESTLMSFLISENDFKVAQEIQSLTGITQTMINKYGIRTAQFDKFMHERYHSDEGKILFQAHNSNYDIGVLFASTPLTKKVIDRNYICDSAKFAKDFRLGYADTKVSSIKGFVTYGLFFDDGVSDYSISKKIKSKGDFVFPDIRNEYNVIRKGSSYYLQGKREQQTIFMTNDPNDLLTRLDNKDIPLNRVKYSVVSLAQYDCIRSMLLKDIREKVIMVPKTEYEKDMVLKRQGLVDLVMEIQEGYHFDKSTALNLYLFKKYLRLNNRNDDCNKIDGGFNIKVEQVTRGGKKKEVDVYVTHMEHIEKAIREKFLEENKEMHERYNCAWEYKKVIDEFDPTKPTLTKEQVNGLIYKTGLEEERIRRIVKEVYDYKKAHGLENKSFYIHELHNNIDERGDVCLEGMLVVKRLVNRFYNQYSKNYDTAIKKFVDTVKDTCIKNVIRNNLEDDLSIISENSYTKAQLESFGQRKDEDGNKHMSSLVEKALNLEKIYYQPKTLENKFLVKARESKMANVYDHKQTALVTEIIDFVIARELLRENDTENELTPFVCDNKFKNNKYEKALKDKELRSRVMQSLLEKKRVLSSMYEALEEKANEYNDFLNNVFGGFTLSKDRNVLKEISKELWSGLLNQSYMVDSKLMENNPLTYEFRDFFKEKMVNDIVELYEKFGLKEGFDGTVYDYSRLIEDVKREVDLNVKSPNYNLIDTISTFKMNPEKFACSKSAYAIRRHFLQKQILQECDYAQELLIDRTSELIEVANKAKSSVKNKF